MRLTMALTLTALSGVASPSRAAIQDAELVLEVLPVALPDRIWEAAPPRFVLLSSGRFYIGGSERVAEGRLDGREHKTLRKEIERVRKARHASPVKLGEGETQYRLRLGKELEIIATGDPNQAPYSARPLAALLLLLTQFDHASLTWYRPDTYRLVLRKGSLPGGCHRWTFSFPLVDALPTPRTVPADAVSSWPTGVYPAQVCAGDVTYIATLTPLLPGE
jgi:hypothetical protein